MARPELKLIVIFIILYFIIQPNNTGAQSIDDFRYEDKIRIREAVKIFSACGNIVWENWNDNSYPLLLVTNENEYLINHNFPTDDFKLIGYDSLIESKIYTRPRQFSNNMLATFPAVNGISTIVVGLPENTSRSSLSWTVTILHEHFHQFQTSKPDYYMSVDSLELSGGDKSGMWMLNYNFPYGNEQVDAQYKLLTLSAKDILLSKDTLEFEANLEKYFVERKKFKELLNDKDYRYFSFQIWQEGISRYIEIKFADCMKDDYEPTDEFEKLNDYIPLDSFYANSIDKLLRRADTQTLAGNQRDCFYTLGAMEGLILDKINSGWKDLYFEKKFFIENYSETVE